MSRNTPDCREIEGSLAAYVDGECPPADQAGIDGHLQACPACRTRVGAERAAHDLLGARRDRLRSCAPPSLHQRCAAQRAVPPQRRVSRSPWLPMSLAATVAFAASVLFFFGVGSTAETYAAQLAVDHLKCFQFPPERVGKDVAAVGAAWQAAHGWPLRVTAAGAEGLELVGIRRCGSTRGRVAHLLYRWGGEPLSVYVLNAALYDQQRRRDSAESVVKLGERFLIWTERDRTYAVVARRPQHELEQAMRSVRRMIE